MERVKMLGKLSMIIAASAALSFGQMAGVQNQGTYPAQHQTITPGTVNYTEGQVLLDNQTLQGNGASIVMQPGETLTTGNGFAEVLLTPGAYLRLGHNSEVRLTAAGLASTQIQLDRGMASVEADQLIRGTNLAIAMNGATARLEKNGLYNFNADQQTIRVLDGKANVEAAGGTKNIGKGDELMLATNKPLKVRDFNEKAEKAEPLYVWSEARSQVESQANVAVAQNVVAYGGWYGPGWYWDPFWSSYAFLPGTGLLYSPFGWGFYSPAFIGYYGLPFGYGRYYGGFHGRVGGFNARVGGFSSGAGFHSAGGFHGVGGGGRR
jgi:hypothetical protein